MLDSYRDYKIDLIEDKVPERITSTVLEHIISKGFQSLQDLYHELGNNESIIVCGVTGKVNVYNCKYAGDLTREEFEEYIKYLDYEKKHYK